MEFEKVLEKYTDSDGKIDYNMLCRAEVIPEEYLIENMDRFDPDLVSTCQRLSDNAMFILSTKLNWELVSKYQVLSEESLKIAFQCNRISDNYIVLKNFIKYQKVSDGLKEQIYKKAIEIKNGMNKSFINNCSYTPADVKYKHNSLVSEICEYLKYYTDVVTNSNGRVEQVPNKFSLDMIEALASNIDWVFVSRHINLPEPFINKYKDKVSWLLVCKYQNLSETFILEHADLVDWNMVWQYQHIREKYIDIFDKIDNSPFKWKNICTYQRLSKEFIESHINKIDWNLISIYQTLSEDFIEKHADKLNWNTIYKNQLLNTDFIIKHQDKFKLF